MNLSSPTTMFAAWVLLPVVVAVISGGLGLLLERAAGTRLGLLAFPFGFSVAIVVEILLISIGLPADLASLLVAILATTGIALRQLRPREGERTIGQIARSPGSNVGSAATAGVITYIVCMIPLIATGKIGVLGYFFLNDPAFHIAAVEWIHAHGYSDPATVNSAFSGASELINTGYPTGTYAWPVLGITFLGISGLALWTPLCAITLAMLAVLAHVFVRRSGASALWAVPLALCIAAAYLPMSYLLQGGLKELLFVLAFTLSGYALTTIAPERADLKSLFRATIPAAFAVASMIVLFGPGAGVWIGQLTVFAFVLAMIAAPRLNIPRLRIILTVVLWGALIVVITLPALIAALKQLGTVQAVAGDATGIGNLLGFVPNRSMLPGWVSDDYRADATSTGFGTISFVVVAAAAALLVIGGIREFFSRRFFVPVVGFTAAIALAYLTYSYNNAYFSAKAMVTFVPVIGCAVASGLIWLIRSHGSYRVLGVVLAAAFAFTISAGYVKNYAHAWMTPTDRLEELAAIDARLAGKGPSVLNDGEVYGQSELREAEAAVPSSMLSVITNGVQTRDDGGASLSVPQDLDGYEPAWIAGRKAIISRRGPGGSRPPSNFEFWFSTRHYDVWRRAGEPPKVHIPFGLQTISGLGKLNCSDPKTRTVLRSAQTANSTVVIATRPTPPKVILAGDIDQSPKWSGPDANGYFARPNDAEGSFEAQLKAGERYRLYTQGQFGAGIAAFVNGEKTGSVTRELGLPQYWTPLGSFDGAADTQFSIKPFGASELAPGATRQDYIRSFAVVQEQPKEALVETDAAGARAYCGKEIDWLEVL